MTIIYNCELNGIPIGFILDGGQDSDGIVVPTVANVNDPRFWETIKLAKFLFDDFKNYADSLTWNYPYAPQERNTPIEYQADRLEFIEGLLQKSQDILDYRSRTRGVPSKKKQRDGYVYVLKSITEPPVFKIGRTKNLSQRVGNLGTQLPFEIIVLHTIKTNDSFLAEEKLHYQYADKRANGEWFTLSEQDIQAICAIPEMMFEVKS